MVKSTVYLNNASKVLQLQVDCTSPNVDEQILRVAQTLCPFLVQENAKDSANHLSIKTLVGGLSNALFVVSSPCRSVLVRIHPSKDKIVDREEENRVLAWLSQCGKAPIFYGRFLNGRVEEFYEGYAPLACSDMVIEAQLIATKLADLHCLKVPSSVLRPTSVGQIWTRVEEWFQMLLTSFSASQQEEGQESTLHVRDEKPLVDHTGNDAVLNVHYMHSQWQWLQQQLTSQPVSSNTGIVFARQLVFGHMDAQSLNLLRNKGGDVKVIDFEYAGLHPRAADLANTFCEYCDMNNLQGNWKVQYPNREQQEDFLKAYVKRCRVDMDSDCLENFRKEVNKHTLVSHLGWATWSLVQQHLSDIDFDYLAYARHRIDGYQYFKHKFWAS